MSIPATSRFFAGLATLVFWAASAAADEKPVELPSPPTKLPATAPAPAVIGSACAAPERTISKLDILIREHQSATTLPALAVREVEVSRCPAATLGIGWLEQKQSCPGLELKPRETIEEVTCITAEPVNVVDPATGCAHIEYQQVPVVKKVRVTVFDLVPVERHFLVAVPYLKTVPVTEVVKKITVTPTSVPALRTTLEAIPVPCEVPVPAPPCTLPPPMN